MSDAPAAGRRGHRMLLFKRLDIRCDLSLLMSQFPVLRDLLGELSNAVWPLLRRGPAAAEDLQPLLL